MTNIKKNTYTPIICYTFNLEKMCENCESSGSFHNTNSQNKSTVTKSKSPELNAVRLVQT